MPKHNGKPMGGMIDRDGAGYGIRGPVRDFSRHLLWFERLKIFGFEPSQRRRILRKMRERYA